ncbi:MAG: hypothetical protein ABSH56_24885 [Bryobacteraceae bacterium]
MTRRSSLSDGTLTVASFVNALRRAVVEGATSPMGATTTAAGVSGTASLAGLLSGGALSSGSISIWLSSSTKMNTSRMAFRSAAVESAIVHQR